MLSRASYGGVSGDTGAQPRSYFKLRTFPGCDCLVQHSLTQLNGCVLIQRPHGDPRRIDSEWTRVDPFTRVYPRDAWGFAEPGLVENTDPSSRDEFPSKMVVLGTGQVYSQLLHRARSVAAW